MTLAGSLACQLFLKHCVRKMAKKSSNTEKNDCLQKLEVLSRFAVPTILPDGNGGFTPCPQLLTEDEAIRFLRLDSIDVEDPANTLKYYRQKGLLRATQVGKCIRYRRVELEKLLDKLTDINPR